MCWLATAPPARSEYLHMCRNIYTYLHTIYILYLPLQVKVTVQRAAVPPLSLVEEDEQMVTPPSVIKIVTGQGPSPADVQVNRGKISV